MIRQPIVERVRTNMKKSFSHLICYILLHFVIILQSNSYFIMHFYAMYIALKVIYSFNLVYLDLNLPLTGLIVNLST